MVPAPPEDGTPRPFSLSWHVPLYSKQWSVWSCIISLGWLMSWSFDCSGTSAGWLSWAVWWLRTGSTVLAILLSARSRHRLSWERWLRPLHLLGPVLLGCCRLQLTSLSSVIVPQPPLPCEEWGGRTLWVSVDSSLIVDLRWSCDCTAHSNTLFIGLVSLIAFFCEAFSWTIFGSGNFPLFHNGQVFHEFVCPLTIVLPHIFVNLSLQCSPI